MEVNRQSLVNSAISLPCFSPGWKLWVPVCLHWTERAPQRDWWWRVVRGCTCCRVEARRQCHRLGLSWLVPGPRRRLVTREVLSLPCHLSPAHAPLPFQVSPTPHSPVRSGGNTMEDTKEGEDGEPIRRRRGCQELGSLSPVPALYVRAQDTLRETCLADTCFSSSGWDCLLPRGLSSV